MHGTFTDGRRRLAAVLVFPGADDPTLARARVLNGAGVLALDQHDDVPTARRLFRESLTLYRRYQHDPGIAWVLIHLSWLCLDIGRPEPARRFLRHALPLCERLNDRRGIARCLNLLGYLAWWEGDLDASRDLHRRSLALNRELGDRWGTGWAIQRLCVTLCCMAEIGQGEVSAVRPLIEEGLTIWRELGERRHFAFALSDLGTVAILERDFEHAHRWLAESQSIFAELGGPHGLLWGLQLHQFLLATAGHLEPALRVLAAFHAPAPWKERWKRQLLLAQEGLGAEVIAKASLEGRAMTLPEAIAYAQRASTDGVGSGQAVPAD